MDSTCIHGETESGEQHDRQSRPSSDSCVKVSQLIVKRNLLVGNDSELDGFNRGAADGRSRRVFGEPQSFWRAAEFLESRRVYWRAAGFIGEPRGFLESRFRSSDSQEPRWYWCHLCRGGQNCRKGDVGQPSSEASHRYQFSIAVSFAARLFCSRS